MTVARTPRRTCVGCRRTRPQGELIRVAIAPPGRIVVSRTAPGRGAWLCDPPQQCLATAARRHAFTRAFRRPVSDQMIDQLQHLLGRDEASERVAPASRRPRGRGTE